MVCSDRGYARAQRSFNLRRSNGAASVPAAGVCLSLGPERHVPGGHPRRTRLSEYRNELVTSDKTP